MLGFLVIHPFASRFLSWVLMCWCVMPTAWAMVLVPTVIVCLCQPSVTLARYMRQQNSAGVKSRMLSKMRLGHWV